MDFSDVVNATVYVSHREVKVPSVHRGERFYLKFYLIDDQGQEVLAVTAGDQGDAHYRYTNAKGFNQYGKLDSNSRKDVIMWLEKIIRMSKQRRSGFLSEGNSGNQIPTDEHPEGVFLVKENQEHVILPDSRRSTRWYLIDEFGKSHLAVIGVENHARDGHYLYTAQQPFAKYFPLECRNKAGVYHWLERWIVHGSDDGGSQSQRPGPNRLQREKRRRPVVLDIEKDESDRLTASPKRQRTYTLEAEETKNEGSHVPLWVQKGREQAQQEAYRRRTIAVRSLSWLKSEPHEDDIKIVDYWHDILKRLIQMWENSEKKNAQESVTEGKEPASEAQDGEDEEPPDDNYLGGESNPHWLRLCLEALKELGTLYMPLRLMEKTKILQTIMRLKTFPDKVIARYASHVAEDWRHMMLSHTKILMDPIYLEDPIRKFEEKVGSCAPAHQGSGLGGVKVEPTAEAPSSILKPIGEDDATEPLMDGKLSGSNARKRSGPTGHKMKEGSGTSFPGVAADGPSDQGKLRATFGGVEGSELCHRPIVEVSHNLHTPTHPADRNGGSDGHAKDVLQTLVSPGGQDVGRATRTPGLGTIGEKELPSIARNQRGLKELPGSRSDAEVSDVQSDLSFNLEDIPDDFLETAPPLDGSDQDD